MAFSHAGHMLHSKICLNMNFYFLLLLLHKSTLIMPVTEAREVKTPVPVAKIWTGGAVETSTSELQQDVDSVFFGYHRDLVSPHSRSFIWSSLGA